MWSPLRWAEERASSSSRSRRRYWDWGTGALPMTCLRREWRGLLAQHRQLTNCGPQFQVHPLDLLLTDVNPSRDIKNISTVLLSRRQARQSVVFMVMKFQISVCVTIPSKLLRGWLPTFRKNIPSQPLARKSVFPKRWYYLPDCTVSWVKRPQHEEVSL
jgi:hypothetical protein